jgi:uncharacterized protein DUF4238
METNNPRRHHFLPVSYLRNFCSDQGDLYVYERGKPPRKSVPKKEAHIRDFYAYEGESGQNFEVENILSRYESDAAPVVQGIVDRARTKAHRHLKDVETEILRKLVALMFVRVPAGRKYQEEHAAPAARKLLEESARDPQKFAAVTRELHDNEPLSDQQRAELIEDARLKILNGHYNQPQPPWYRLQAMLEVASMIEETLRQYSCRIVLAPKHEGFITGDTPIVTATEFGDKSQLGTAFASKDTAIWFPISSKVCTLWRRGIEAGYGKLPPRGVRMVNRNMMRYAERFAYSSQYSLKLAGVFTRIPQQIFLGKNVFIPMWEGKPILTDK